MAHFAELDDNNKVIRVNHAPDNITEEEIVARTGLKVKRCSYNTKGGIHFDPITNEPSEDQSKSFRKNFPGCGWIYREDIDGFVPGQPYPSWTLNFNTGLYQAPVPMPLNQPNGYLAEWDEENQAWILPE